MLFKWFVTTCLFAGICFSTQSQDFRSDGRNGFGLKAGANLSSVRFVPSIELGSYTGYYFGAEFVHQRDITAFAIEAVYANYGWTETFVNRPSADFTGDEIYSRSLNYLEFPMTAYLRTTPSKIWHILAFMGPKISFFLNETVTDTTPDSFERYYYDEPIEPHVEFGLFFGGGFSMSFDKIGEFVFEARSNISFENLFEREDTSPEIQYSQPRGLMVGLKYWYFF